MRFSFIAAFAFVGIALAQAKLPSGQPCNKDGNLGVCESGLCVQLPDQPQGKCQ
ncbi:hypothetical protein BDV29DRAFT_157332 [Aspergillus leporis]|uniref:Uncharacterized protein n=1 Tax=Aspergillus leporis TaxID=41062 RepID=A0A5N5X2Y2_9EURO|nr:hypothetical protein BDV29DRAFT_157332 [Aspergillus leporis]